MMNSNTRPNPAGLHRTCLLHVATIVLIVISCTSATKVSAQPSGGSTSPNKAETKNKPDQNLKSVARVNPSTLAMEMTVPIANYPGRNGTSMPFELRYSSKQWLLAGAHTWWYY